MEHQECCCHKTKERSEEEYKSLIHRLNRVEGQIRGIRGMLEKKRILHRHSGPGGRCQRGAQRLQSGAAVRTHPDLCCPGHSGGEGRDH